MKLLAFTATALTIIPLLTMPAQASPAHHPHRGKAAPVSRISRTEKKAASKRPPHGAKAVRMGKASKMEERVALLEAEIQTLKAERDAERAARNSRAEEPAPASGSPKASADQVRESAGGGVLPLGLKLQTGVQDEHHHLAGAEIGPKGVKIVSEDGQYSLQFQGLIQIDGRYFAQGDIDGRSEFSDRRTRPGLVFKAGKFTGMLQEEIASGTSRLLEAYVDYQFAPELKLRFGKMKPPLDMERWQSNADLKFAEMNVVSFFSPDREYGVMGYGTLFDGLAEYQAGLFNGGVDGLNNDNDEDGGKDVTARFVVSPFKKTEHDALKGIIVGAAGSVGRHKGSPASVSPQYRTPGRQLIYRYAQGVFGDGAQERLVPQFYWNYKQAEFMAEYALSRSEVNVAGGVPRMLQHQAWQTQFSWVWTGESPNFISGITPKENFNLKDGHWGAFESAVRFGTVDFDDDAFPLYADPTVAATDATLFGLAFNWYLNPNIRFLLDYEYTTFNGGGAAPGGGVTDRTPEQAIIARAQLRF